MRGKELGTGERIPHSWCDIGIHISFDSQWKGNARLHSRVDNVDKSVLAVEINGRRRGRIEVDGGTAARIARILS